MGMCKPDTADYSYIIQPDGTCRAIPNHLFKKYRWWCIGLGILLIFLVLVGCAGLCQCCCAGGGSQTRVARTYDSDSDEAPRYVPGRRSGYNKITDLDSDEAPRYVPGRRLGMY